MSEAKCKYTSPNLVRRIRIFCIVIRQIFSRSTSCSSSASSEPAERRAAQRIVQMKNFERKACDMPRSENRVQWKQLKSSSSSSCARRCIGSKFEISKTLASGRSSSSRGAPRRRRRRRGRRAYRRGRRRPSPAGPSPPASATKLLAKVRSFSAVSGPIFASKYAFFFFFKIYQIIISS